MCYNQFRKRIIFWGGILCQLQLYMLFLQKMYLIFYL